jgi:hypothetical protein
MEYLTELPPKEVLERKVQEIVLRAKENQAKLSGHTSYTIDEEED